MKNKDLILEALRSSFTIIRKYAPKDKYRAEVILKVMDAIKERETFMETKEPEKEKVIYKVADGVSTITCDGKSHLLNASHGRRLKVSECQCAVWA